jgi:shikimate kinase
MSHTQPRHIAIIGLMGAGKTTVGRALAARLGWAWRDSDATIEAATGRTVRELRDEEGVDAMHDREAAALLTALAEQTPSVISAAASVVDVPECREALDDPGVGVVWLRARPATLAARFDSSAHRPAYGASPEAFLAEQAARRDPLMASLRPITIDVDDTPPDAVVARVLDAIESDAA